MSFNENCKKLQSDGFSVRFAEALRKRLAPNTSLTVQRLAGALRTSERTIWTWLKGGGVRGEVLVDVMNFFGDGFANEVRGIRLETDRELVRLESELARILAARRAR